MKHRRKLNVKRLRRSRRVRSKVRGAAERPRLSIFRSNAAMYAQLIDDVLGKTLASASSRTAKKGKKTDAAAEVGESIAGRAKELGIKEVAVDRGSYRYHGRVKALVEAARKAGLRC